MREVLAKQRSPVFSAFPNHRVERTAAERLGFDMIGFMNIIRYSWSARSAAVAHSGRWAIESRQGMC